MSELKPCPFCGKKARVENDQIVCGCKATWNIKDGDVVGAIAEWNTRPLEDKLLREIQPTCGALKRMYEGSQRALTMAMTELTEARDENERLRSLLRRVEWVWSNTSCVAICPVCHRRKDYGHADDCEYKAVMGEVRD